MVIIETSLGPIKLALDTVNTPITAENFLQYVRDGFYDGTIFHRVIDDFMIQGGGLQPGMKEKETRGPIENEAERAQSNKRGTVAMARTMEPHSATAQFFINVKDNDFLNFTSANANGFGYCVFGEVVEGMEIVDQIKAVKTGHSQGHDDVPLEDVLITRVTIEEA